MDTSDFQAWLLNAALILAGALALLYAITSPDTRARNAIFSLALFSAVVYRIWNLQL